MNDSEDPDSVSKPSSDSSQLHMRTWLDDLALWLPTQLSDYATLVEHGYVLTSQGKVATFDLDHTLAIRDRLQPLRSFDDSSPRVPTFAFSTPSTTQAAAGTAGPQTRSQALSGASAAPAATAASASVSLSTVPGSIPRPPPLTPDESKRFIFAPEMIDAIDRKMMNAILETIASQAARRAYSAPSAGSGRELLRQLTIEARATSNATNAKAAQHTYSVVTGCPCSSFMIHALDIRGISEPKVALFNSFVHSIERLNRALPAATRLPDSVIAEKLANA
eukprot:981961-Pleurochrysis_carterae.AAC.1